MSHCLSISWMVILKAADAAACQREDEETELQDLRTFNANYLQWDK